MKKGLVFLITIVLVSGLLAVGFGCQEETTDESAKIEPTTTPLPVTGTPTPTPFSTDTEETATLDNQVYTNEDFGYKITLPAGYTADVEEFRSEAYYGGGRDTVRIKDANGEAFATIATPPPEVGWQGYLWDQGTETEIAVPGSDQSLYMLKAEPDPEMGNENNIIMVSWGAKFMEGFDSNDVFAESGIIYMTYSHDDVEKAETFEEMVRTLRFI